MLWQTRQPFCEVSWPPWRTSCPGRGEDTQHGCGWGWRGLCCLWVLLELLLPWGWVLPALLCCLTSQHCCLLCCLCLSVSISGCMTSVCAWQGHPARSCGLVLPQQMDLVVCVPNSPLWGALRRPPVTWAAAGKAPVALQADGVFPLRGYWFPRGTFVRAVGTSPSHCFPETWTFTHKRVVQEAVKPLGKLPQHPSIEGLWVQNTPGGSPRSVGERAGKVPMMATGTR